MSQRRRIGPERAATIRSLAADNMPQEKIAKMFRISQQSVSLIITGKSYGRPARKVRPKSTRLTADSKLSDIATSPAFIASRLNAALATVRDHHCRTCAEVAYEMKCSAQGAALHLKRLKEMGLVEPVGRYPLLGGETGNSSIMYEPTPAAYRIPAPEEKAA